MINKSKTAKLVAGFVGVAMALSFAVPAFADTASDLQAQINSLMATINSLQSQLSSATGSSSMSTGYTFNTNLTVGSTGTDVMNLQKVLNMSADTQVAATGTGSKGMESSYFGGLTKSAVMKFQTKNGISPVSGYVGPLTRAKLNSMNTVVVVPPPTCTSNCTLPSGGNLTVTAGSQPANSLAPLSAARIPFTTVTLSAGSSDVTVNSITVERVGLAQDSVLSGVVLLGPDGTQIGIAKTLNSNHQAMVGEPWVIKAGTSQTVTVAGNRPASDASTVAGQVVGLNVVAVNTSATVAGSFPIMGAQHTVNSSLTLGGATVLISSFDPGSAQTKEIGTTGYKFSGVRVTAGSAEQVKVWSIRWNQSGSASSNDLGNIKVYVDGTAYPTTVSTDGKYYTATFPGGILLDKGMSKDIYIQGDIIGTGAANRTIRFDLYKTTDLYVSGVTYGYGITPSGSGTGFGTTPWYTGSVVTVSAGSVTSLQKATSVAAQNIAVNVPNQVLGGFMTDLKGEPISVQTMVFYVSTSTVTSPVTNVTIVDSNGAIVAGPVDASSAGVLTFTDTVTFPVGQKVYTLKGKIPTGTTNGATLVATAIPAQWLNITGQTTGNTISFPSAQVAMNTMTVKAASLAISVATTPSAQNIVAGGQAITFANYQFDASQSGEDVRLSTIPLKLTYTGGSPAAAPTQLTSCQLFDGATALNTGSNAVNPTTALLSTNVSGGDITFTMDQQLVVPKGTVKTITLKCNVSSAAVTGNSYNWGLGSPSITVTGVTSSADVSESVTSSVGQIQTVANGSLVVSLDSSSPSYTVVSAGSTGNIAGVFKFRASNDSVNLNRLGLKLTSGSSSDIMQVSVWDGATQVGTATFTGSSSYATSTFASSVLLPKDTDKILTIKVDTAQVGTSQPGSQGALIKVNFNGSDPTGTEGTGVGSGNTVDATGSTLVAGVRNFKSFPTLSLDTTSLGSSGIADGRLMRFKVTANANGQVGISHFAFTISTTSATVTQIGLFAYNDSSYSNPISGQGTSGQISAGNTAGVTNGTAFSIDPTTNPVEVSAGSTMYFELRGSVTGVISGSSVVTTLLGDSAYPTWLPQTIGGTVFNVATSSAVKSNGATSNFVWSGNATSTSAFADIDWSNGYGIPGFSASGLIQTRSN